MDERRAFNEAIGSAVADALRSHDLSTIRHTIQITSFGGSGTTALCEFATARGLDVPATPNHFPWKHQRVPPATNEVPDGFRVVYPYGDPRNAVVSVFRRGYQDGHYRWMRGNPPPADVYDRMESLERYLEAGVDQFLLENHFDCWIGRAAKGYPVLFVRYEELGDHWDRLAEFLALPAGDPPLEVQARTSDWTSLPRRQRRRIDRMYGGFARRLAALPAVHLA